MGGTGKLVISLACLVPVAAQSVAEEAFPPPVGARVRVTAPSVLSRRLAGTLAEVSEREIVLALSSTQRMTIPLDAVTRLERSRGRHGYWAPGAAVGAVLGGAFFGAATLALCDAASCSVSMPAVLVGAAVGALPGAGIGALIRTERWEETKRPRVGLGVAPARGGGVAASLSVRF
jgi:hypothetical protein